MDIMGVLAEDHKQLTLLYSSETTVGKQTLAYAEASDKNVLTIDVSKTKVTGTQWVEIAERLGTTVSHLVNTTHPDFVKLYGSEAVNLSTDDWVKVLQKQPEVLKGCVVLNGLECLIVENPSDIVKYLGVEGEDIKE